LKTAEQRQIRQLTLVMREDVAVVQDVLGWFNRHQLPALNVNGQLDLCLATQRHCLCLQHSVHCHTTSFKHISQTKLSQ